MDNLFDELNRYADSDYYPMHMPGHKRNIKLLPQLNPYAADITEIEGFDDLHHADGILKEAMQRAAELYQSERTYFLINGSSGGIITAVSACADYGDTVIMARNCHKSTYHAIALKQLRPVYVYPGIVQDYKIAGSILPEDIKKLIKEYPQAKAVILTSPTYEGIVTDIKEIAAICHNFHIPLIVDEAHGAHFGFSEFFPENSVKCGADIVIQSVHKTLPAFTQTALLHVNGGLADIEKIEFYLNVFESSSPSYVLMAGIDQCMNLLRQNKKELFHSLENNLIEFYKNVGKFTKLKVFAPKTGTRQVYGFDQSKLVISTQKTDITGKLLYDKLLNEYKIQMEMANKEYVIGISTICDTKEGFKRLYDALAAIEQKVKWKESIQEQKWTYFMPLQQAIVPWKALEADSYTCSIECCEGKAAAEYGYLYPPGIPIFVPGEKLTADLLKDIKTLIEAGFKISGIRDSTFNSLKVL